MRNNALKLFCLFFCVAVCWSCDSNRRSYVGKDIQENEWHKDSVYTFISDSIITDDAPLLFFFEARVNEHYPYRNMYMFVEVEFPNGEGFIDTLEHEIMLPNGQKGKDCIEFSSAVQTTSKRYNYALNQAPSGVYSARIQHGMRDSLLPGVLDIAFKIDKFQP